MFEVVIIGALAPWANLSLSPGEVDEENGLVEFAWTAVVADGQTGIKRVDTSLGLRNGDPRLGGSGAGYWLGWGSYAEGLWHGEASLEALPAGGTWPILDVTIEDKAGNKARYTRADLEAMGLPTDLTQEPF